MVVTVQGYNGKKNKAACTAASLAAMSAMVKMSKTLIIQLINKDINSAENILIGKSMEEHVIKKDELEFTDDGIDSMLRTVDVTKLMKSDFDSMCTPLLKGENHFDVASITKSYNLGSVLVNKKDAISNLIENAKAVYDNIFILMPSDNDEVSAMVNEMELVDKSVYCMTQGFFRKGTVYGKNVVYVVTDFETSSYYSLKTVKKTYENSSKIRKERVFKIAHNVGFNDAVKGGRLLQFARINRNLTKEDANFQWSEDVKNILAYLLDEKYSEMEVSDEWEKEEALRLNPLCDIEEIHQREDADNLITQEPEAFDEETLAAEESSNMELIEVVGKESISIPEEGILLGEVNVPDKGMLMNTGERNLTHKKGFPFLKKHKTPKYVSKPLGEISIKPQAQDFESSVEASDYFTETSNGSERKGDSQDMMPATVNLEVVEKEVKPVSVWICPDCGTENKGNFCMECGMKKPRPEIWTCPECGTESKGKFCPECGTKRND